MKTCVMDCHTHSWINVSKPSSKSVCEDLKKWHLGLRVQQTVKNIAFDYTSDIMARS